MKNHPIPKLFISVILVIFYLQSLAFEQSQVITELSKRSHTPENEIKELLSHCNKAITQLNMNICADRDAVVADLKLRKVLLNKKLQLSACKSMIDTKIALWQKLRNRGCEIATEDLSGGSIRPLIQVNCITDETGKMIKKLGNINNCSQLNQITEPLQIKLNSLSSD